MSPGGEGGQAEGWPGGQGLVPQVPLAGKRPELPAGSRLGWGQAWRRRTGEARRRPRRPAWPWQARWLTDPAPEPLGKRSLGGNPFTLERRHSAASRA